MLDGAALEQVWLSLRAHLPRHVPSPKGGGRWSDDRLVFQAVAEMLVYGLPYGAITKARYGVSGSTVWRRLEEWTVSGVVGVVFRTLVRRLERLGLIDATRLCLDTRHLRAKRGGRGTGRSPVDRGKSGVKHAVVVDRRGMPVACGVAAANRHDSKLLPGLLRRAAAAVGALAGRKIHGDKGFDTPTCHEAVTHHGALDRIARIGVEAKERLGRHRWVVESAIATLSCYRRLVQRWERSDAMNETWLQLACLFMVVRRVQRLGS